MKLKWIILSILIILVLIAIYKGYQYKQIWDKGIITYKFVGIDIGKISLVGSTKITTKIDFYFDNKTDYRATIKDFNFKAYYNNKLLIDSIEDFNTSRISIKRNGVTIIPAQIVLYVNSDTVKLILAVLAGKQENILTQTKFSLLGIRIPYKYNYLVDKKDWE